MFDIFLVRRVYI